jgi:hypothetical protein
MAIKELEDQYKVVFAELQLESSLTIEELEDQGKVVYAELLLESSAGK